MAQFYQVVNGSTATFTFEELRAMYPNIQNVQCIDGSNASIQYIINQDDSAVQYHNQVIGIDQTGATVQLETYQHQPVVLDSSLSQQGVYVIETVDPSTQVAVDLQDQQVIARHHATPQFVVQQLQAQLSSQNHSSQAHISSQQQHSQIQQSGQQQTIVYGRPQGDNGITLLDASLQISGAARLVAEPENSPQKTQVANDLAHSSGNMNNITKFQNNQVGQKAQTHLVAHVNQLQGSVLQLPNGQKITLTDWQQFQHQQIHLQQQNKHQSQQQGDKQLLHQQQHHQEPREQRQLQTQIQTQLKSPPEQNTLQLQPQSAHLQQQQTGSTQSLQPHQVQQIQLQLRSPQIASSPQQPSQLQQQQLVQPQIQQQIEQQQHLHLQQQQIQQQQLQQQLQQQQLKQQQLQQLHHQQQQQRIQQQQHSQQHLQQHLQQHPQQRPQLHSQPHPQQPPQQHPLQHPQLQQQQLRLAKSSNNQQQILLELANTQQNNETTQNVNLMPPKQPERPGVISVTCQNVETNSVIVSPGRTQTVQQKRKRQTQAQQRRMQQNISKQTHIHQQQTTQPQFSQMEQSSEQVAVQTSPRATHQFPSPRRTYGNKRARSHTLIANNTVQAIASPTGEHQNLLQQHDNVISVVDQNNQVEEQAHAKEVQLQSPKSTQVVLLLPNGEQRIINVDESAHSIKDILGHIGINLDSKITIANELNVPFEQINQSTKEIIKTETVPETQDHSASPVKDLPTSILQKAITSTPTTSTQQIKIEQEPADQKSITIELPKYVDGMLALCHNCGYTSLDFTRCQRCKKKLPENVKSVAVADSPTKKIPTSSKEKCGKLMIKVETEVGKNAKKPRQRRTRKLVEEPVILTLSSDDEDQRQNDTEQSMDRSLSNNHSMSIENSHFAGLDNTVTASAMDKEPVISSQEEQSVAMVDAVEGMRGSKMVLNLDGIIDGSVAGQYTLLQCRTVRIGSYKVVPTERVILSSVGMRICVPSIEDESKAVILLLDIKDVVKVLIHFGRGMPVLFFYAQSSAAARIRNALKMESRNGPYYDPTSQDDTQKRITLLPERLTEDCKVILKSIFNNPNILGELNNKEANDILVRASPKEVQNMMKKAAGFSPQKPVNNEIQTVLVYPPHPGKGGIPINTEDYACLGEDQFLNDVIIDFYLRYLTLSVLSEFDQQRTHVFSSFFYKRLTTRPVRSARRSHPVEDDPKLSAAEKRHTRVKSWTKNVNLFEKDYIVIPINEHCHWFLAIICFPGLTGPVRMCDNIPVNEPVNQCRAKSKKKVPVMETPPKSLQIGCTTITPVKCTDTITLETGEDGSDRDEAEGEDEDMDHSSTDEEEGGSPSDEENSSKTNNIPDQPQKEIPKGKQPKSAAEPIKQPCILIFDSLAGASRTRVVATLRDYLRIECKVKGGKERDFSKDTIRGGSPKVPQQTNFTDCGLYLLQYVESFFQDPIKDYRLPMKALANWFPEEVVNRKREELQKLLLSLMEKSGADIASLNLPKLAFSNFQESKLKMESSNGEDSETPVRDGDPAETSTEDEPQSNFSSVIQGLGQPINSSGSSSCEPASVYTTTSPDSISVKSERVSLVNYSDDSDEKNSTSVDSDTSSPTQTKKSNTLTYLKSKRIERHMNKDVDRSPAKKIRTDLTPNQENR